MLRSLRGIIAPIVLRLSIGMEDRFLRQVNLDGWTAATQQTLQDSKVVIVGAGGLGAPVIAYLAGTGIGTIAISEFKDERIEPSNLPRQFLYQQNDLNCTKRYKAVEFLKERSPFTAISYPPINHDDGAHLLANASIIVDATDSFKSKYLLADIAAHSGVPLVWGSIVGYRFQVSLFCSQPSEWLASFGSPCTLRDVYPKPPLPGKTEDGVTYGTFGPACGQAGSIMAGEVLKYLTEQGKPLFNRIVYGDAKNGEARTIPYVVQKFTHL